MGHLMAICSVLGNVLLGEFMVQAVADVRLLKPPHRAELWIRGDYCVTFI